MNPGGPFNVIFGVLVTCFGWSPDERDPCRCNPRGHQVSEFRPRNDSAAHSVYMPDARTRHPICGRIVSGSPAQVLEELASSALLERVILLGSLLLSSDSVPSTHVSETHLSGPRLPGFQRELSYM
jgi:hypothetical protein